jgi:hypothetical protein
MRAHHESHSIAGIDTIESSTRVWMGRLFSDAGVTIVGL